MSVTVLCSHDCFKLLEWFRSFATQTQQFSLKRRMTKTQEQCVTKILLRDNQSKESEPTTIVVILKVAPTLVLDCTVSLHMRHFFTRGEHREQVATWPHGPNSMSRFMSEQTMHSSNPSFSSTSARVTVLIFCVPLPRKDGKDVDKNGSGCIVKQKVYIIWVKIALHVRYTQWYFS